MNFFCRLWRYLWVLLFAAIATTWIHAQTDSEEGGKAKEATPSLDASSDATEKPLILHLDLLPEISEAERRQVGPVQPRKTPEPLPPLKDTLPLKTDAEDETSWIYSYRRDFEAAEQTLKLGVKSDRITFKTDVQKTEDGTELHYIEIEIRFP